MGQRARGAGPAADDGGSASFNHSTSVITSCKEGGDISNDVSPSSSLVAHNTIAMQEQKKNKV